MSKYYLKFFIFMVILMNSIFTVILLNNFKNEVKLEYVYYFYPWLSVLIVNYFTILYKTEKYNRYLSKYYVLFPIRRSSVLLNEWAKRILEKKFLIVVSSSSITFLIFGYKAGIYYIPHLLAFIFFILYNSFFIIILKNFFSGEKSIKKLYVVQNLLYFIAFLPYFLILGKVDVTLDIFSRYLPFGGLFLSLFVYKNVFIYLLFALLSFLILFFLFNKASEKWDI